MFSANGKTGRTRWVGILAVVLCAAAAHARAATPDTLYLKDGGKRIGTITSQDSAYVMLRTANDNLVISTDEVARIGRATPRVILMPEFGVALDAAYSSPQQLPLPSNVGLRLGVRWLITGGFGVRATFTYSQWQYNYDTLIGFKYTVPQTHTFSVTAASPRAGIFAASRLAPRVQLLLGADIGMTVLSASGTDTTGGTSSSFSYAARGDVRIALGDILAVQIGVEYEGFTNPWTGLDQHTVLDGEAHRAGDILVAAGLEVGF